MHEHRSDSRLHRVRSHDRTTRLALLALALVLALALGGCGQRAASAPWPGPFPVVAASPTAVPPLSLPRDEAPHNALTEWWYYTGHLRGADGTAYGFESVIFQSSRADFPPFFAAHAAITDQQRGDFRFAEQSGAAEVKPAAGFDLRLGEWYWRGAGGNDRLASQVEGYAFTLDLQAVKPPALHNGGYIDFGPSGGSYYYSRTRMAVRGTLDDHGVTKEVTGEAWFDHQWGNFLGIGGGGWDWFSAQLADGSDFTLSLLRGLDQQLSGAYGTYVAPDGTDSFIAREDLQVEVTASWTSPRTGVTYPAGWRVTLPRQGLTLRFTPVIPDQELDTRASTATIYWEGAVAIAGERDGHPITGAGYVELTGYDQATGARRP